jgi:hypothetical protein
MGRVAPDEQMRVESDGVGPAGRAGGGVSVVAGGARLFAEDGHGPGVAAGSPQPLAPQPGRGPATARSSGKTASSSGAAGRFRRWRSRMRRCSPLARARTRASSAPTVAVRDAGEPALAAAGCSSVMPAGRAWPAHRRSGDGPSVGSRVRAGARIPGSHASAAGGQAGGPPGATCGG